MERPYFSTPPAVPRLRPGRRLVVVVGATAVVLGSTYLARELTGDPPPAPPPGPPAAAVEPQLAPAVPAAGADDALLERFQRAIDAWTASLAANEANYLAATNLGLTYAGRARITGDLEDYQRALEAADLALTASPADLAARELRATVLFALHDFAAARTEALAVLDQAPDALQARAVLGDASLELGDLEAARAAFDELGRLAPSAPVWSRLAHVAFVTGDRDRAISLASSAAATDAGLPPEEAAFYAFQLGELHRSAGDVAEAEAAYLTALDRLPGHVPATVGLARVREDQGRRAEAITLLEAAVARVPQPETVALLGDLHALADDPAAAEDQYALVERIGAVAAAGGSVYDRQLVLFAADHDRGVEAAVTAARAALVERDDVYAHDALAWALFKAGQPAEAALEADLALRLGTQDPRLHYHAGLIAAALGDGADARRHLTLAVAGSAYLPPLQVPVARAALAALDAEADGSQTR
jgi:tetratricopeptide (TPR) repeat protein